METKRGIPMVELITNSKIRFYTDSNGIICFDESSLMDQEVYFDIFSHGYKCKGMNITLFAVPGECDTIFLSRINVAERIYRITGQDIYGESVRAGIPSPIRRQALNGKVTGQDTFIEAKYKGMIYWFWGDTFGPNSFNGSVSGATSRLPWKGGLNPDAGIDLEYFMDSTGLNRSMCDIPGPGLVWIDWLANLTDEYENEKLFAKYTRTKNLDEAFERGIAVFDDSSSVFRSVIRINEWLDKVHSSGHPVKIQSDNKFYFYIFDGYGLERFPADTERILDPKSYEQFTCLESGTKITDPRIERNEDKRIIYDWKINTESFSSKQQQQLINSGLLEENEGWINPLNILSGEKILLEPSSVFWNNYRKRWIMIAYEFCGKVWFLEADTPTGPWVYARKVVSHDNYDFYNVGQHPLFDQDDGRIIYFEGTYTTGFSGNTNPTPLYNYNQMMYRLRMDDIKLTLPVPVYYIETLSFYLTGKDVDSLKLWDHIKEIPFFALPVNRIPEGVIPLYSNQINGKNRLSTNPGEANNSVTPLFYALSPELDQKVQISGKWDCYFDGFPMTIDLNVQDNQVIAKMEDPSLEYVNGSFLEDSIRIIIRDTIEKDTFLLMVHVINVNMSGRFESVSNNYSGVISGEKRLNVYLELFYSPATTPLFEYQNEDGSFYYSTESDLPLTKRSDKPLCRVWYNPVSILALDYMAKPIQIKE